MIIKKFQGKNEEEALSLAKKELGDGVVVMNSRKVKPKGLFSFLKSMVFEVTVAKEEEQEFQTKPSDIQEALSSVDKLRKEAELAAGSNPDIAIEKLDNIQNLLEKKLNQNNTDNDLPKAVEDMVNAEPADEKEEVPDNIHEFIRLLYNTMVDNEVSEQYANQVIEEIEQNYNSNMEMEYILSHIYQKMILKFGKPEIIDSNSGKHPRFIFFIGPTGVGKTTTLAKIASLLNVVDSKKIALITADTYRIAATEQLKTYANILKAPFQIIYTPEEINETGEMFKDYDYILVDTAGHSHKNDEQRNMTMDFINAVKGKADYEVYLVLSATTKYRDLVKIVDSYEGIDYKLIFTKLDETCVYGNLFNIHNYTKAPMSYLTCGQNVPDDIETFDPQDIVRKLLGGNS